MLKKQVVSFIFVGVLNTIVGYSLYSLFIFFGLHYFLALFVATVLGTLFNFQTIGRFVFGSSDNRLLIKFVVTYIIVFSINIILIKIFKILGENDYVSGLYAVLPCAIISFLLNKLYVFRK